MTRRARLLGVLAVLAAGAVGVIAATQTWLEVTLADGASDTLPVAGADAVPLLTPLSLAALAIGAALTIVGTVLRYVLGALTVLIGATLVYVVGRVVFAQPVDAVAGAVTDATGITGDAVSSLVSDIAATPWPVVALVAAVVLASAGVFVLATARRWRESARRFRTDAATASHMSGEASARPDAIDSWDELSRGEDPTA
ncbi:Trp biosynthesis-associated membrane protein [Microbacterium immunditiarum]|uniref:Putative membrane protein (TIGR02234 family) n=1 Tax=Microbacterium immunditiarum TaxID=337480 RepID=A0A7Y9GPL7_9MICO|nr:Trp biosynthesis-associated membrane protein [Microbacterium immunditiarum]NYE20374.1 putative membrane protein (TIGR02234 family) [Microbacterium immunditiarum]